jgi:hypothetical protein
MGRFEIPFSSASVFFPSFAQSASSFFVFCSSEAELIDSASGFSSPLRTSHEFQVISSQVPLLQGVFSSRLSEWPSPKLLFQAGVPPGQ